MKKITYISILALLFALVMPVAAQQIYKGQIGVSTATMEREGNSVNVHMMLDLSRLELDRNRSLTLTPVITGANMQRELPDILINGTTRQKAYLRSQALGGEDNKNTGSYSVIKLDKKSKGELHYSQTIPYEDWMADAHLDMKEDLCGCGGHEQEMYVERVIENMPPVVTPYMITPQIAYIQPNVEAVKSRSEQCETFLDFPVNKTNILPTYMQNPSELAKIEDMLRTVRTDNNLTVTRIDITGYASPEGPIAHNENLSKGRAEAFKKYVLPKFDFPADMYHVQYGGENWDGLLAAVEASTMNDKEAILDILKNTSDVNARKNKLKALNGGVPYRQMLTEIYPKLRKVVSSAYYTVRGFDVEESKEILESRPQQLSLDEMFRIANTHQAGSTEFTDVFETAVKMYPDDKVANLNAAAAALAADNLSAAERYLMKADTNSAEYANNMGILYLKRGDLQQAKTQFAKAAAAGISSANYNLQEVNKKIENDARIK
ncbi:DUF3868 domain-containing protein [Prevotella sp. 10(H)]|uniref:DUF3868 domain-containing protein n=1 Tax=Prevotella sp. 10(H) TaxID=1158294 RepID=UPI0004A6E67E|nr:DUF3868 domain-containing protein [Prevotella sp. 10(H)]